MKVLKKGSYRSRIFKSILLLIVSLVFIFAMYTYYDYMQECKESARKEARNVSSLLVSQIDEKLTSLKSYYTVSADNDDIEWILKNDMDYSDYSRYKAAYDILAGKTIFSDYVSNFTFVNFKTGWVLSNKGMYKTDESKNLDILENIFDSKTSSNGKVYWYYDNGNIIYSKISRDYRLTSETNGLNIVMKLPFSSYETYGLVVANINLTTWKKWISELVDEYEDVIVVSDDNSVIYSTNGKYNSDVLALAVNGETSGLIDKDGKEYAIGADSSSILGWKYYVVYDVEAAQPSLRLPAAFLLMLLFIIIAAYIFIAQIIYNPIRDLLKGVTKEEEKVSENEIDYLAGVLSNQQDKLKELFELRLLHGEVHEDEWDDYLKSFHLANFKYFATAVVILQINDDEAESMVNEDAICLKLLQEMPAKVRSLAWMPPIYNASAIFAIFAGDDEGILLENIKSYYTMMQTTAISVGGYKMQMGVSATHTSFHHIRAAYRESINALTLKFVNETEDNKSANESYGDCHFYLTSSTVHSQEYTSKYEDDIKAAIKAVDKDLCYQVTDDFYHFLANHNGSEEDMQIYILKFANTILSTAIDAGVDMSVIYPMGVRKLYRELLEVAEPSRVRRYLKANFIDLVLEARTDYLKNHSNNLLEQIENTIMERHGDVSLQECADELGVHQTYIWKVLKMEKGKSFSDYQEEYKLEEAKRLLLETDMTVAEIAEQLHYTNAQNFIRFFNKSTGLTPGKFRKLY